MSRDDLLGWARDIIQDALNELAVSKSVLTATATRRLMQTQIEELVEELVGKELKKRTPPPKKVCTGSKTCGTQSLYSKEVVWRCRSVFCSGARPDIPGTMFVWCPCCHAPMVKMVGA
jgi:hypothetical protein